MNPERDRRRSASFILTVSNGFVFHALFVSARVFDSPLLLPFGRGRRARKREDIRGDYYAETGGGGQASSYQGGSWGGGVEDLEEEDLEFADMDEPPAGRMGAGQREGGADEGRHQLVGGEDEHHTHVQHLTIYCILV